jgi:hypothetical protein
MSSTAKSSPGAAWLVSEDVMYFMDRRRAKRLAVDPEPKATRYQLQQSFQWEEKAPDVLESLTGELHVIDTKEEVFTFEGEELKSGSKQTRNGVQVRLSTFDFDDEDGTLDATVRFKGPHPGAAGAAPGFARPDQSEFLHELAFPTISVETANGEIIVPGSYSSSGLLPNGRCNAQFDGIVKKPKALFVRWLAASSDPKRISFKLENIVLKKSGAGSK